MSTRGGGGIRIEYNLVHLVVECPKISKGNDNTVELRVIYHHIGHWKILSSVSNKNSLASRSQSPNSNGSLKIVHVGNKQKCRPILFDKSL